MLGINRWIVAAIVVGTLLAAMPYFAVDWALVSYMEEQARTRLAVRAQRSLGLAEERLEQASSVLRGLAAAGVQACSPRTLEAMRLAVFTNTPLKGLSILDDQGRALCTHVGALLDTYAVSREYPLSDRGLSLAVARFRDLNERAVRLDFDLPRGRALAALIAVDALLPEPEQDGSGRRLRLLFEGGEMIAARPAGDGSIGFDDGGSIAVYRASASFPIVVVAEQSRHALAAGYQDLQFVARIGTLFFLACMTVLLLLLVRRKRDDPAETLRRALQRGEIVPFYQPTVDIQTGRIRGAEVLARWRRPDGSFVPPAQFIPVAEQSGHIFELTKILMERARDEIGAVYRDRPQLRLGFNLFAGHLTNPKIVDDVKRIFGGSQISPGQIVLEVTERTPLPDLDLARRVIEMLQEFGAKVAIDDVGSGHGGLSYLLKLGVDIIKIDKMFIDSIGTERYSQTIIETLVELGRTMGMGVIAEGVETFEQIEYLRVKGVGEAQGHAFAPALPTSSYLALVEAMERPRLSVVAERREALVGAA